MCHFKSFSGFITDPEPLAVPVPVQDLNRFSGGSGSGSEGFLPTGPVLGYLDRPVHNTGTTPEADKQGQVREFLDELLQRSRLWQGLVSALLDKRILGVVGLPLPTKKPECGTVRTSTLVFSSVGSVSLSENFFTQSHSSAQSCHSHHCTGRPG